MYYYPFLVESSIEFKIHAKGMIADFEGNGKRYYPFYLFGGESNVMSAYLGMLVKLNVGICLISRAFIFSITNRTIYRQAEVSATIG